MKKYLLGLFAVVLAIGFSAFTSTTEETTQYLNWYRTDGSVVTEVLQENIAADKDDIKSSFSTCPDMSGVPCVFGTDQDLDVDESIPGSLDRDAQILKF